MFAVNRWVRLRNQQRTAWADIDVQLQRRHESRQQQVSVVQANAGYEAAIAGIAWYSEGGMGSLGSLSKVGGNSLSSQIASSSLPPAAPRVRTAAVPRVVVEALEVAAAAAASARGFRRWV